MRICQGLHLAGYDCVQRWKNRLRRIILGLSWLFLFRFRNNNIQNTDSLKECNFSYSDKPKHSDHIPFILLSWIHYWGKEIMSKLRNTNCVYCLLFLSIDRLLITGRLKSRKPLVQLWSFSYGSISYNQFKYNQFIMCMVHVFRCYNLCCACSIWWV